MEEALHDTPLYCEFAGLDPGATRLPDESTILRFRHLLEANNLNLQIMAAINAVSAPRTTDLPGEAEFAMLEIARQIRKKASYQSQYARTFDEIAFCDSLNNCSTINSRICGG